MHKILKYYRNKIFVYVLKIIKRSNCSEVGQKISDTSQWHHKITMVILSEFYICDKINISREGSIDHIRVLKKLTA